MSDHPHPLKVHYPHGGKHLLLRWWSHDEQHQIVLARSDAGVARTVTFLFSDSDLAKRVRGPLSEMRFVSYQEIDVVAPPVALCAQAAAKERTQEIKQFVQQVTWAVGAATLEAGAVPPAPFKACKRYSYMYAGTGKPPESYRRRHNMCKNCDGGVRLTVAPETFYDRYAEVWWTTFPKDRPRTWPDDPERPTTYSRAELARDGEDLWAAVADFGHHDPGVVLQYVREPISRVLFYFHAVRALDVQPFKDQLAAVVAEEAQARAARAAMAEARVKRENAETLAKMFAVFAKRQIA